MTHNIVRTLSRTIDGVEYSAETQSLPLAGIAYLLDYGFSQAMADTQALGIAALAAAAVKAKAITEADGKAIGDTKATLAAFAASNPEVAAAFNGWAAEFLASRAKARLAAIVAGDMTFGSSERLTPEEKDRRELTETALKDAAVAAGKKLPPKAEDRRPMLERIYEMRKGDIEAEVARRAKVRAKAAPVSVDSLAGLFD